MKILYNIFRRKNKMNNSKMSKNKKKSKYHMNKRNKFQKA